MPEPLTTYYSPGGILHAFNRHAGLAALPNLHSPAHPLTCSPAHPLTRVHRQSTATELVHSPFGLLVLVGNAAHVLGQVAVEIVFGAGGAVDESFRARCWESADHRRRAGIQLCARATVRIVFQWLYVVRPRCGAAELPRRTSSSAANRASSSPSTCKPTTNRETPRDVDLPRSKELCFATKKHQITAPGVGDAHHDHELRAPSNARSGEGRILK